jgi:hypothetical protein
MKFGRVSWAWIHPCAYTKLYTVHMGIYYLTNTALNFDLPEMQPKGKPMPENAVKRRS